jgi:hypothetical protein
MLYLRFIRAIPATMTTARQTLICDSLLNAAASASIFRKRSAKRSDDNDDVVAVTGTALVSRVRMATFRASHLSCSYIARNER